MTIFLFPSDYFRPTLVDEMYLSEATAFRQAGFQVAVVSLESLSSDSPQIRPSLTPDALCNLPWLDAGCI
ncbi:hypothetical protein [Chamaesiphon sp. VAR_48_metabat_403]|uniref:hypothetical protein n=1 Tax=Chamaesiphon sp. VAR_48_metabat_403 TaxID=2964700 RepID=UPI00286E8C3F|nr:hypothetical protein [Chamaesiphon sp. VAR_48_metabat_403]